MCQQKGVFFGNLSDKNQGKLLQQLEKKFSNTDPLLLIKTLLEINPRIWRGGGIKKGVYIIRKSDLWQFENAVKHV